MMQFQDNKSRIYFNMRPIPTISFYKTNKDREGKMHNSDGPAIIQNSGAKIYMIDGMFPKDKRSFIFIEEYEYHYNIPVVTKKSFIHEIWLKIRKVVSEIYGY